MSNNLGLAPELRHLAISNAKAALEKIYKIYQGKLLHLAVIMLKDTSVAEEVVNDTFLQLWKNRADISDDQHIAGFLRVALRFACINAIKKLNRDNRKPDNVQNDFEQAAAIHFLQREDILKRVLAIAETLPPQTREVFRLFLLEKTYEEIAIELGISTEAARAQTSRARQIIENKLLNSSDRDAYLMFLFICCLGSTYSA